MSSPALLFDDAFLPPVENDTLPDDAFNTNTQWNNDNNNNDQYNDDYNDLPLHSDMNDNFPNVLTPSPPSFPEFSLSQPNQLFANTSFEPTRKRVRVEDESSYFNLSSSTFPAVYPLPAAYSSGGVSASQQQQHMSVNTHNNTHLSPMPTTPSHGSLPSSPNPQDDEKLNPLDRGEMKKKKHQETDRQRRAKIKSSMDQLKSLVAIDPSEKPDQATLVASSVKAIATLKDEVALLRAKLQEMELKESQAAAQAQHEQRQLTYIKKQNGEMAASLPTSALTGLMASLNSAGVSMWRVDLSGRILEVNQVFEMVCGWPAATLVGNTPCHAPLFGSMSVMPASFLKQFSQYNEIPAIKPEQSLTSPTSYLEDDSYSPTSPNTSESADLSTPTLHTSISSASSPSPSSSSTAPPYTSSSIANLPILPQSQLQSFFPSHLDCKQIINPQPADGVTKPQPHGSYLINHIASLPHGHVLKLLSRCSTAFGETLESIVTLGLVRDPSGRPDHVISISTPDSRRFIPSTHSYHNPAYTFANRVSADILDTNSKHQSFMSDPTDDWINHEA